MTKIIVYHRGYGCDTGCCGHAIEIKDGNRIDEEFVFDHPDPDTETKRAFTERIITEKLGAEHVADLDWDNCEVVNDWN